MDAISVNRVAPRADAAKKSGRFYKDAQYRAQAANPLIRPATSPSLPS